MILFTLLFGIEMDVAHIEKTQIITQGILDASTLAGASQNHQVITGSDGAGAPTNFTWVLNDDNSPEAAAQQTWYKNQEYWNGKIDMNTIPQWFRDGNKAFGGTTMQTVQETISSNMVKGWFGEQPFTQIWVPNISISYVPY